MKNTFTDRELFLLEEQLKYDVVRYLIVNTKGKEDGYERADRHIAISKTICKFLLCRTHNLPYMEVHNYLTELTAFMDEQIGFPVNRTIYGNEYDAFVEKFINKIKEMLPSISELINSNLDLE